MSSRFATALLATSFALFSQIGYAADIEWRVVDRFRLFGIDQPDEVEELLKKVQGSDDLFSRYDDFKKVLVQNGDGPAEKIRRGMPFTDRFSRESFPKKKYIGYAPGYLYPKGYRVAAKWSGGSAEQFCQWILGGRTQVQKVKCDAEVIIKVEASGTGGLWGVLVPKKLVVRTLDGKDGEDQDIKIRDVLIAGLGDSFASGEGNPDRPTTWNSLPPGLAKDNPTWYQKKENLKQGARWTENSCHRSLLNYQVITALKIAADHPHDAVTLVHLACSGAEIFNGLLAKQANRDVSPQLQNLEELRCRGQALAQSGQRPKALKTTTWFMERGPTLVPRQMFCDKNKRQVDLVLLSIGGNDIGFAGGIAWAMLPTEAPRWKFRQRVLTSIVNSKQVICPEYVDRVADPRCKKEYLSSIFVANLAKPFEELSKALNKIGVPGERVLHNSYPNPAIKTMSDSRQSKYCPGKELDAYADSRKNKKNFELYTPGIEAAKSLLELFWSDKARQLRLDDDEHYILDTVVIIPLLKKLHDIGSARGYVSVADHAAWREIRDGHGWCAIKDSGLVAESQELQTPLWSGVAKYPFAPYDKNTARYFRTLNDTVLTQFPNSKTLDGRNLLDSIRGFMHPTFSGHLKMADANHAKAEEIIYATSD